MCSINSLSMLSHADLRLKEEALSKVTPLDVPLGGSGRTTSCWPSWRAADYAASGREELARFAGSRVTLRTPVGIIRDAALCLLCRYRHKRHTFAATALQKGISLATVQKILGHDRLQTTAIYLNFTD